MRETRQERGGQIAAWWVAPSHPSEAAVLFVPKYYSREPGKCSHPAGTWFVFVQRQEQAAMPAAHHEGPGSNPGTLSLGFVVNRVELGQIFLRVLALSVIFAVESNVN
jgi:hypothetical protein